MINFAAAAANLVSSVGLSAAAVFALAMARRPRPLDERPFGPLVAAAIAAGLVFLALDEGIELHDIIGRWLERDLGVVAPGPINHVDDLVLVGYMAAGAVVLALNLRGLARRPHLLGALLAAGAMYAAATAFDALGGSDGWTNVPEETLETVAALIIALAFGVEAWPRTSVSAGQPRPAGPDDSQQANTVL